MSEIETTTDGATAPETFPEGALVFRTMIHAGSWTSTEGETYNDLVVVENPSETLIRDAAHAHSAGVIEVLQGLDLATVQSQEEGEAEYEKAVADGRWQEGQKQQAALEQEARDRGEYGISADKAAEEVVNDETA